MGGRMEGGKNGRMDGWQGEKSEDPFWACSLKLAACGFRPSLPTISPWPQIALEDPACQLPVQGARLPSSRSASTLMESNRDRFLEAWHGFFGH